MVKVGDEDPEEEWTDIEGVVSARAVGRRRVGWLLEVFDAGRVGGRRRERVAVAD